MTGGPCPCGSGLEYGQCCGPFLAGAANAETAEQLMRSRYVAFVRCDPAYLMVTWHASTRPVDLRLDKETKWLGLKILRLDAGGVGDANGLVEFVARAKAGDRAAERLHETSRFVREDGRWFYVDGDLFEK